ncbi:heparinase [Siculibacillus lacustris]|uniref:Heparinase n=1 Tax=Siculibacillus lacustris TaxID=1549641 RepID=A0A4Q9VV26_9HYPH|nr:heparinase II/III family protein [Siculibacillus lacustris]TBW40068.1 heparinase [Siculibacillus lacustris]
MANKRPATTRAEWKLVGRRIARRLVVPVVRGVRATRALFEPAADRLAIAPQDLRTADATVAADIYAGVFVFSGRIVDCRGRSPFESVAPNREWARVLHGFGWLRHLRAADTALARSNARILVDDWLRIAEHAPIAWEPEVVARRTMAWLAQSPMILADADQGFYHRFLTGLTRQFRWLRIRMGEEPAGLPRLRVVIAVLTAALAVDGFRRWVRPSLRRLDEELKRQILPDGGHVGRNPLAVLEILIDLLPIRQALAARGFPVSAVMMGAIDRMMPMVRFFRHTDGTVALFNGASSTPTDLVATVLAYDDGQGRPHGNAPHAGYQRLEAGRVVVIVDCGPPPPPELARSAHAGTLAFELSSGPDRFVVNCGAPLRPTGDWARVARSTAAHSTLIVEDHASSLIREIRGAAALGTVLVRGPTRVGVARDETADRVSVVADHDGYVRDFGVIHERILTLATDGSRLDGRDAVHPVAARDGAVAFVLRFHLHPAVKVARLAGGAVVLVGHGGEAWEFHCDEVEPTVEDSVHLADPHGIRRTSQIVVTVAADGPRELSWRFLHTARAPTGRR